MKTNQITVRVPATTANLGPGYDCIGMALDWWNEISMKVSDKPHVSIVGEGNTELSLGEDNLIYRSAQEFFKRVKGNIEPLDIICKNTIPLARGLGSSAAAIVGGIVAANAVSGNLLGQRELLDLAVEIEGHGDNVAPALLGGCQIVVKDEEKIFCSSVNLAKDMDVIIFVPDQSMSTQEGRSLLPDRISRKNAVYNMGRLGMLVNSLSTGNLENLLVATQDKLHQPYREQIFPAMKYIIRSAKKAGAIGAFLSGGGSSVAAFATSRTMTIGYEMADVADKIGIPGSLKVTKPSIMGAHVISS
jgi:homoserine kinase